MKNRTDSDFERAFHLVKASVSPVMPSDIQRIFNDWWLHVGQFECASVQDNHKETVFGAFLAGWEYASRLSSKREPFAP